VIDCLFFAFSIAETNKDIQYCLHAVIIICATTFMQATYNYIPGTNLVSTVYTRNVTSALWLQQCNM
jgi:hypothetical protein